MAPSNLKSELPLIPQAHKIALTMTVRQQNVTALPTIMTAECDSPTHDHDHDHLRLQGGALALDDVYTSSLCNSVKAQHNCIFHQRDWVHVAHPDLDTAYRGWTTHLHIIPNVARLHPYISYTYPYAPRCRKRPCSVIFFQVLLKYRTATHYKSPEFLGPRSQTQP